VPCWSKRLALILAPAFLESFGAEIDASMEETEHVFRTVAGASDYEAALADLTHWFEQTIRPSLGGVAPWKLPG
jgi:prophage maintenance system killer protein